MLRFFVLMFEFLVEISYRKDLRGVSIVSAATSAVQDASRQEDSTGRFQLQGRDEDPPDLFREIGRAHV